MKTKILLILILLFLSNIFAYQLKWGFIIKIRNPILIYSKIFEKIPIMRYIWSEEGGARKRFYELVGEIFPEYKDFLKIKEFYLMGEINDKIHLKELAWIDPIFDIPSFFSKHSVYLIFKGSKKELNLFNLFLKKMYKADIEDYMNYTIAKMPNGQILIERVLNEFVIIKSLKLEEESISIPILDFENDSQLAIGIINNKVLNVFKSERIEEGYTKMALEIQKDRLKITFISPIGDEKIKTYLSKELRVIGDFCEIKGIKTKKRDYIISEIKKVFSPVNSESEEVLKIFLNTFDDYKYISISRLMVKKHEGTLIYINGKMNMERVYKIIEALDVHTYKVINYISFEIENSKPLLILLSDSGMIISDLSSSSIKNLFYESQRLNYYLEKIGLKEINKITFFSLYKSYSIIEKKLGEEVMTEIIETEYLKDQYLYKLLFIK